MAINATIQSIIDYYGSDSSIYQKIVLGQATDAEISYAFSQIPRMKVDVSAAGSIMGYSYDDPVYIVPSATDVIINTVDSNSGGSGYGGGVSTKYPISFERDSQTGEAFINAGKNGLGNTIKAVADRVSLGVTGVNIGCKLGKAIDEALYNLDPDWWDKNYPTINPDTWPSLVGENETGQKFFRTLFNIDDNGNVTGYVDERILAQTYQMLRDNGGFGGSTYDLETYTPKNTDWNLSYPNYLSFPVSISSNVPIVFIRNDIPYMGSASGNGTILIIGVDQISGSRHYTGAVFVSNEIFTVTLNNQSQVVQPVSIEGHTYYSTGSIGSNAGNTSWNIPLNTMTSIYSRDLVKIAFNQNITFGGLDGVTDIDGATQYPPTNITGTTLDDVLQQLKTQYPDLFTDSITENVIQSDGTVTPRTYVPVPWQITDPTNKTQTSPITRSEPTTQTYIDTEVAPQVITQTEPSPLDDPTTPPPDNPDTGSGSTDPIILPTGQASSLWAIYNPTQAQVDSFGGWLWSSNFVEQLKKLFNDPMQAIIGIHKVFATPHTGSTQTIVCGYLDSGVPSKVVTSQYTDVDCGSVNLREYFGNVFDYSPFTSVKMFLPFIGIVPLDVAYIMRSTISVKYTVDVLTGACVANITVNRDGAGGVIFTYAGSAIVSYPISSGSYVGVISGALSIAAGIAGTVASGGMTLPAVAGAVSGLSRAHTDIQHSGQFSGAAGAMGGKKPYLIIERPQTRIADNVDDYEGKPSNATLRIGDCVGFTRVIDAHLSIPNAYASETAEILQLLKEGVII